MTTFQSLPDLESSGVQGTTVPAPQGSSLFMIQLLTELSNQTIVLKRINSKLWKLVDLLSKETSDNELAQFDNTGGDQ